MRRIIMYIYQRDEWPQFTWDRYIIEKKLPLVKFNQGLLLGKMRQLGFTAQEEASLITQTANIIQSSSIENEHLNADDVRSSIARHLGMKGPKKYDRSVDGIVSMHLDATRHCNKPLTEERLYDWHSLLFPTSFTGTQLINTGVFRGDQNGPMQVVSDVAGREKIHFQAPNADILPREISIFLTWFNAKPKFDGLIKAAIAHLWFVTLHPFEDGNGRIARAIADMALARDDAQPHRYYSMSAEIRLERKQYYDVLERTQKNTLDITEWLLWFLDCFDSAIHHSDKILKHILNKASFWQTYAKEPFNERQIMMLNVLFDGFKGVLTSTKWAQMTKCSQDTATRDIQELMKKNILIRSAEGGRSTRYLLKDYPIHIISG